MYTSSFEIFFLQFQILSVLEFIFIETTGLLCIAYSRNRGIHFSPYSRMKEIEDITKKEYGGGVPNYKTDVK